MKKEEFLKLIFRCHYSGELMTDPRGKSNRQKYDEAAAKLLKYEADYSGMSNKETKAAANKLVAIGKVKDLIATLEPNKDELLLSSTAKKRLRSIMIEAKYKRSKRIKNKYVTKGKDCEEEAITIYSKFKHKNFKNNTERVTSDYLTGEIDLKDEKKGVVVEVIDIKNRYDIDTLLDKEDEENNKADYWQLTAYGILFPTAERLTIANCLVNNTLDAIQLELRREEFTWIEGVVPQERQVEIIKDNIFDKKTFIKYVSLLVGVLDENGEEAVKDFVEIPEKERVIEVTQLKNIEAEERLITRLEVCREYMAEKWGD